MSLREMVVANTEDIDRAWFETSVKDIEDDPTTIRRIFPSVTRSIGTAESDGWRLDDAARVAMLEAAKANAANEIPDLYRYGDTNERRAVLLSLDHIEGCEDGITLVRDALRTNDTNLVTAALGKFAFEHLSDDEIRNAIMKCVFMDIPLNSIDNVTTQSSPELSRTLAGFVLERVTAGRSINADVWTLIDCYPPAQELSAIKAELDSPFEDRRQAADEALAGRTSN
jgi:hypothetical protein